MSTPRRYQFDNQLPTLHTPQPLIHRPEPLITPAAADQAVTLVQHIHQAPPDRTVQRVALGAGIGGGAVVAGVFVGPMVITLLASAAVPLAFLALVLVAGAWGVVSVVRSIGGPEGKAAAKTLRRKG
ncbi:DUF6251 family protein [Streptomyces decoyicus]|uniref:DUF6251 family protein n=1 Tax=Streptomyces decoyicus TaxID=249567 RepID=UPI0038290E68